MQKQDVIFAKLIKIERLLSEQNDEPLDFEGAASFLKFSKSHLYKLTSTNQIPHYKPNGKRVYFSKAELKAWLLRNPVKSIEAIEQESTDYVVNGREGGKK